MLTYVMLLSAAAPFSVYCPTRADGRCRICGEEHFDCNFLNAQKKCEICHKTARDCPAYASKSKHVINKILDLLSSGKPLQCSPVATRRFGRKGHHKRPLKVIVYSQERAVYEYFGDHMIRRFGVSHLIYTFFSNRWKSAKP